MREHKRESRISPPGPREARIRRFIRATLADFLCTKSPGNAGAFELQKLSRRSVLRDDRAAEVVVHADRYQIDAAT
jgi:hypothetical protein